MSTARFRSGWSSTVATSAAATSAEAGSAVCAEDKPSWDKIVCDGQSNLLGEMDILRQEIETLQARVIPIVSHLVTRVQALEESNIRAETADKERNKEIKDQRRDVNGLLESRAETAQKMDLQFNRAAELLAKLQNASVD